MSNSNGKVADAADSSDLNVVETTTLQPYKVMVSLRFMILTMTASILGAFAVGQLARFILLEKHGIKQHTDRDRGNGQHLPPPIAKDGKEVPPTIYTAKNFDTARTASSSLLIRRDEDSHLKPKQRTCSSDEQSCRAKAKEVLPTEDEHLPAGQHLLVDMKGLDAAFLNSEERLAYAMVEVVNQASLTLLSYHCHTLLPSGVSCVGVLLESHVSFHTWPSAGVITLDLFTCGSNPLVPVVPMIERLFGVPASPNEPPKVVWSHKLRGFRKHRSALQMWDLGVGVLGTMDMDLKKEILSFETAYQRIDIYDTIAPRFNSVENYEKSLATDNSYYSKNPDLFAPDRSVFLDGIMQSTSKGERAYHESLVHPAMFAHPNPNRVAVIGGGEGATLREVLKHNTVKEALMIEIDEEMVAVSRQHLRDWSDCSDLIGSAKWCGDDPRARVHYDDALAWFIDRYFDKNNITDDYLDVIIMDALDPHDDVEFSDALYNNEKYLTALYNGLSEDGILVVQVGQSPGRNDPPESLTHHKNREIMIDYLDKLGFKSIQIYGQAHGGYTSTWNTVFASKSLKARANWYRNEAEVNLEMSRRAVKSKSGSSLFHYFDGATMQLLQVPSKRFENVFCLKDPQPDECSKYRGYDPEIPNADISNLEVKASGVGENAGRGLFATRDIPKGSYFTIETTTRSVFFPPNTLRLITEMETLSDELTPVEFYMFGYGFQSQTHGDKEVAVDPSITTFANHGCNGQYNSGFDTGDLNEMTADLTEMPAILDAKASTSGAYNPVNDRNLRLLISGTETTLRDIKAGDEILDNYLAFVGHQSDWEFDILHLRAQCSGDQVGDITLYEATEGSVPQKAGM